MKRFLIVRLSAIGDCIQTLPLAVALKQSQPDCRITWVVDCAAEQLLHGHPSIDEVIRLKKGFAARPKEMLRWYQEQRGRYDTVIDPQGLFKSALLGTLTRAPQRIGFTSPQSRELAWLSYSHPVRPLPGHLIIKQLGLLEPIGILPDLQPATQPDFGWRDDPQEDAWGTQTMAAMGLERNQFVLVNPGAGWPSKLWDTKKFSSVAQAIYERFRLPSIVAWGGSDERKLAESIVDGSPQACRLAPDTRLRQLAWLLGRSRLFIGGDTGPMHLAVAVGCPTIALFGPTDPNHCGPLGPQHRALRVPLAAEDSKPARKRMRKTDNRQMTLLSSESVFEACCESLSS